MARYIGPKCRLARREGTDLLLKSNTRALDTKCKLDTPPGQHGERHGRLTDYGRQLRMKQLIKRYYGLLEKQFHNYYKMADKKRGSTGENLLRLLESRLDNVVYRLGFASTRSEARQMVSHRSILVNGKIVNIASYLVMPNEVIEITEKHKNKDRVANALKLSSGRDTPDWLSIDSDKKSGVFVRYPNLDEMPPEFQVHQVVELYSK